MYRILLILAALSALWGADKPVLTLDASNRPVPLAVGDQIKLPATAGGGFSTTIAVPNGASYTATFPAVTGTLAALNLAQTFTAQQQVQAAGALLHRQASTQDGMAIQGRAGGTSSYSGTFTPTTLSASRTYTAPDADITLAGGTGTANQIGYWSSTNSLTGSTALTYNGTTNLTLGADASSAPALNINGAVSYRVLRFKTASLTRWDLATSSTAESGSDAGSPLTISAYNDAGTLIDTPVSITRATGGGITLARPLTVTGATLVTTGGMRLNSASNTNKYVADAAAWGDTKFDSQGTAWSSRTLGTGFIFNGGATERPEISWYRGGNTYPEFTIREHTTNNTGGEIYAGAGSGAPTLAMGISSSAVTIPVNITQTGATTFSTGTGAISLNGDVLVAATKHLGFGASTSLVGVWYSNSSTATHGSGASQYGFASYINGGTDATTRIVGYDARATTTAGAFTCVDLIQYAGNLGTLTLGAGSSVTRFANYYSNKSAVGGTANFGFAHGSAATLPAISGTYCFYNNTSDPIYLGTGQTSSGSTTDASSTTTGSITTLGGVSWGVTKSAFGGGFFSTSPTLGIGYAAGAGGTVTQATSRTTGVTLNKVTGAITLVSAAGTTSWQTFTVTDSAVAATDTVRVVQKSGTDKYMIHVTAVGSGTFDITFATTGGTTSEQPVFNFVVIKGASS